MSLPGFIGYMQLAAGTALFYSSPLFWGAAGVLVSLAGIVVASAISLYVASSGRRLTYSMPVVTPLLNQAADMPAGIEIRRGSQVFTSPRLVSFKLTSKGRKDISDSDFSGGRPLRFDLGTPIAECLPGKPEPGNAPLKVESDGSSLLIGPGFIGAGQTTTITLLVDGDEPVISKPVRTLTDVRLKYKAEVPPLADRINDHSAELLRLLVLALVAGVLAIFTVIPIVAETNGLGHGLVHARVTKLPSVNVCGS